MRSILLLILGLVVTCKSQEKPTPASLDPPRPFIFDVLEMLKRKCAERGEAAIKEFERLYAEGWQCANRLSGEYQREFDLIFNETEPFEDKYEIVCRLSPEILKCLYLASEMYETCMDDVGAARKNNLFHSTKGIADLLCSARGKELIMDAVAELIPLSGWTQCFMSRASEGQNKCLKDQFADDTFIFFLNELDCRSLQEKQACVVRELKNCNVLKIAQLAEEVYERRDEDTQCTSSVLSSSIASRVSLSFFTLISTSLMYKFSAMVMH